MGWIIFALLMLAVWTGAVFYTIVRWALSDAPPGTRICGIKHTPRKGKRK